MQLINLQVRLARADTILTVHIFLVCHLTVLSIAKDTVSDSGTEHEAFGGITLTGERLRTQSVTVELSMKRLVE